MNQITTITKRDIYDLFRLGFSKFIIFDVETIICFHLPISE